jgi:hypothetical protein
LDKNLPHDKDREEEDIGPLTSAYAKYGCFPDEMMENEDF